MFEPTDSEPAALPGSPRKKEQRDTAQGCRDRAAADLLESVTMLTSNERLRLESSASSWTVRAELLDRIETSVARRMAEAGSSTSPEAGPVRLSG
jgi:hypothetical protein